MRVLSVDETAYNLLRRVVTVLTAFYSSFAYIAIMRGDINLLGYLIFFHSAL